MRHLNRTCPPLDKDMMILSSKSTTSLMILCQLGLWHNTRSAKVAFDRTETSTTVTSDPSWGFDSCWSFDNPRLPCLWECSFTAERMALTHSWHTVSDEHLKIRFTKSVLCSSKEHLSVAITLTVNTCWRSTWPRCFPNKSFPSAL